ncbi:helix-turn-helix domain-containing protein [Aeromicrobium sp. Root495]|uniref:helix-turn-helix transcriptional regulator n=1 Tax=Aeromicrobium sp. Root495 TaxID=1736550 RepID=UPI0009EC9280
MLSPRTNRIGRRSMETRTRSSAHRDKGRSPRMGRFPDGDWASIPVDLGRLLVAARSSAGLSQEGLAAVSEVSRVTIAKIESGRTDPQLSTVYRLAAGLGVDLGALLPADPRPRKPGEK